MKKIFYTLLLTGIYLVNLSQTGAQGLKNVIVEKYYVSDANDAAGSVGELPTGSTTYRIYAEMKQGFKFQAVYGIPQPEHELRLATTTKFFNNEDRGGNYANDIKNTYLKNNTVMLDSWLSVGAGSAGNMGVLKGEDNNGAIVNGDGLLKNSDASAGIPLSLEDGLIPGTPKPVTTVGLDNIIGVFGDGSSNGNLFSTTNGSWASLDGAVGPTTENRVLLAQITTDGVFTFDLNIQIGTPSGGVERYVAKNPVGEEKQRDFLIYSSATSNMKPIVKITSPADSSKYNNGESISIIANAFDPDGHITSVEFFADGVSIGKVSSEPYNTSWTVKNGMQIIKAVATDNKGLQDSSQIVLGTVGIKQLTNDKEQLTIYPNPVREQSVISYQVSAKCKVKINVYDLLGNEIKVIENGEKEQGNYEVKFDLAGINNGIYYIRLNAENYSITKKILKMK